MKRAIGPALLGVILLSLSALVYLLHYVIFRDAHHIFIYLLGDLGFVFIEVLLPDQVRFLNVTRAVAVETADDA